MDAMNGKLMAVEVKSAGTTFELGMPKELFDSGLTNVAHTGSYFPFAVQANGQRFLMTRNAANAIGDLASLPIVVVLDWTAGLKR